MVLFDDDDTDTCQAYRACRDHFTKQDVREQLELAWAHTRDFSGDAEPVTIDRFRREFHSVAWEIHLRQTLLHAGINLAKTSAEGPDIAAMFGDQRVWIEAVTVGPGTGPDRVSSFRESGATAGTLYPIESLLLRIRMAIEDKLGQIARWRGKGIVGDDPIVLALNHGLIMDSDLHDEEIPAFVKAVLPFGDLAWAIYPYGQKESHVTTTDRDRVKKKSGTSIPTTLFLDKSSAPISGLMVARQQIWNLRWDLTRDVAILHNPSASQPLPRKRFPARCEMWLEGDELRCEGRCNRFQREQVAPIEVGRIEKQSHSADAARKRELERIRAMSPRERAILALRLGRGLV